MIVAVNLIERGFRIRQASAERVAALAASIREVGLLNPITVRPHPVVRGGLARDGYMLISGLHRLEAAASLGWTEIEATLSALAGSAAIIAECDDNLLDPDISKADRALFTRRRKMAFEWLHPETVHGRRAGRRHNPPRRESFEPGEIVILPRIRAGINEETVQSLMASIERIGLQTPPTVRWSKDGDDDTVLLVSGRHRLEACRRLGMPLVDCLVFEGTEREALMLEIAENLHRADLTRLERAEHEAKWIELSAEGFLVNSDQKPKKGGRPEAGVSLAARFLPIQGDTDEAKRAHLKRSISIAELSDEVKHAVCDAGLADNQSALLKAARAPDTAAGVAVIHEIKAAKTSRRSERDVQRIDPAVPNTIVGDKGVVLDELAQAPQQALTASEQFAAWIVAHTDLHELPQVVSWIEGCKPKDVVAAIRRLKGII
jgi:ParB-like chromosome segregation protein Spo0J